MTDTNKKILTIIAAYTITFAIIVFFGGYIAPEIGGRSARKKAFQDLTEENKVLNDKIKELNNRISNLESAQSHSSSPTSCFRKCRNKEFIAE